jgi:hypothetical protein
LRSDFLSVNLSRLFLKATLVNSFLILAKNLLCCGRVININNKVNKLQEKVGRVIENIVWLLICIDVCRYKY